MVTDSKEKMSVVESHTCQTFGVAHGISIRRIPYPYRAMLAICSDLDETPDRHVYLESMRFLNTTGITAMGQGIGLEVGNTIYFDMPPDQFSYWNTDDAGRAMIQAMIKSGHIDCLHSFGDLATTRAHAERALDELSRHDCSLRVWIDHGVAPSNFGRDIMRGKGDVTGSDAYHADLTCEFGIKYVWRGRVTSIIAQNAPRSVRGVWNIRHPLRSAGTLFKEHIKGILARLGNERYSMHGPNRVLRNAQLRDGRPVFEFIRSNPYRDGVGLGATADGLADVLVKQMLERLVESEGVCVLYTHLGKIKNRDEPFGEPTRQALRLLAGYLFDGKILVTTTRRLLSYCRAIHNAVLSTSTDGGIYMLDIKVESGDTDLSGLSVYVPDPVRTLIKVNGREVKDIRHNEPDHTSRRSVSLPWRPLEFPDIL